MRPDRRVVTRLPLSELWDAEGILQVEKRRIVGCEQVVELLRRGGVRFVLANCGNPLKWIAEKETYRYWREEVKPHLVEPAAAENGFRLEDWPGEYCFVASEWSGRGDATESIVLLETHH